MPSESVVRPFRVDFPEVELAELRRRINATRWPDQETVADDSQGVRLALMQDLARYWGTEHDWRKCEAKLNALLNFITEIDGAGYSFPPRPLPAPGRAAADRHPRVAGLDHRPETTSSKTSRCTG